MAKKDNDTLGNTDRGEHQEKKPEQAPERADKNVEIQKVGKTEVKDAHAAGDGSIGRSEGMDTTAPDVDENQY